MPRLLASVFDLLLVALVTVSGPWAAIAHCPTIDPAHHHQHHARHHHAALRLDNCAVEYTSDLCDTPPLASLASTAFTIAILLPLSLMPEVLAAAISMRQSDGIFRSVTVPPLSPPPRAFLNRSF